MTINFYINISENNKLEKRILQQYSLSGNLRSECSITDPVILIQADAETFAGINYMYIPAFERYYFINDVRSVRNGFVEINAHVDVLMSFANAIKNCDGIVKRQANKWNLYLNDGSLKCYQNPLILTKAFPSGFTTQEFVLAVAGDATGNNS